MDFGKWFLVMIIRNTKKKSCKKCLKQGKVKRMSEQRYKKNILVHMSRTDLVNIKTLLDFYSIYGKAILHMENFAQTYEIIHNAWKRNTNMRW